jgi:hypothetical protein
MNEILETDNRYGKKPHGENHSADHKQHSTPTATSEDDSNKPTSADGIISNALYCRGLAARRNQMEEWKMSVPCKFERSLLRHEEYETIRLTHHPAIYEVEGAELEAMRPRLRKMRDKERTLGRQKRREGRGKGEARGASFPGTAEHASERKQVFAAALKRVNNELRRLHNLTARTAHVEAARKALALHRAANFGTNPPAGVTANEGMVPKASTRRRKIIVGAKIGRVSQATKVAQAARDARGV